MVAAVVAHSLKVDLKKLTTTCSCSHTWTQRIRQMTVRPTSTLHAAIGFFCASFLSFYLFVEASPASFFFLSLLYAFEMQLLLVSKCRKVFYTVHGVAAGCLQRQWQTLEADKRAAKMLQFFVLLPLIFCILFPALYQSLSSWLFWECSWRYSSKKDCK